MVFTQAEENYFVNKGLASLEPNDIEKLQLRGDVVIGDLILNTIDEDGVVWVLTDLEGWWTAPPSDVDVIERGFGDGAYEVAGRYNSRSITLEGVLLVDNPSKVEPARDKLIAALNLARTGAWLKTGTSPIRASYVYLDGDIDIDTVNARGRTEFSVSLRAPDPIKYAWNDEAPDGYELVELPVANADTGETGSTVITNIGNYPVPAIFEVTGPFAGPGSIFNRTSNELIILTQSLKGRLARSVINKELEFSVEDPDLTDVVTLTTTEPHDFSVGNSVFIDGMGEPFDGDQVITSVPTSTTFTYNVSAADIRPISFKAFDTDTGTLETTIDHGFEVDDVLLIVGVDGLFDTLRARVTSVPTSRSFTYAVSRSTPQTLSSSQLTSNIATLSTTQAHGFIVGEEVTIAGAGVNYNGTFEITAVPSETSFSYAATRTNSRELTNLSMTNDVVTFTTSTAHGFVLDEGVNITGVNLSLNGGYTIDNVTTNTFSYFRPRATQRAVTVKALSSNVATITTSEAHGFVVGEKVRIRDVDPEQGGSVTFDGVYEITSLPSNTSFTYNKSGSDIVSTTVTGGTVSSVSRKIRNREVIGNVATIITDATHGAIFGETITITGMGAPFDGTHTVSGIPFLNVLNFEVSSGNIALEEPFVVDRASRSGGVAEISTQVAHGYSVGQAIRVSGIDSSFDGTFTVSGVPSPTKIRYSTPGGADVAEEDTPAGAQVIKDFGFVEMSGDIPSQALTEGLATVGGSLPFAATTGTASVSNVVSRRPAAGNAIKRNNVQFTPGLSGATAVVSSDILEIDTKDHVVAFNGLIDGARGRVDVLADFVKLQPGDNTIEFTDTGNPDGTASLRIYYRSGWLG